MDEEDSVKNTYLKIQEIAARSFRIKVFESTKRFESTSNWILAGTVYAEFTCMMTLRELKQVYPATILKIFMGSLAFSLLWGIAYLIIVHLKRIETNSLDEALLSNKHHEESYMAYNDKLKGFASKSGEEWKQHHVKRAFLEAFQSIWFFIVQLSFFLIAFFSIIVGAFIYLQ